MMLATLLVNANVLETKEKKNSLSNSFYESHFTKVLLMDIIFTIKEFRNMILRWTFYVII